MKQFCEAAFERFRGSNNFISGIEAAAQLSGFFLRCEQTCKKAKFAESKCVKGWDTVKIYLSRFVTAMQWLSRLDSGGRD